MSTETRITRLVVVPEGMQLFHEQATTVEIEDEAGGEFVVVTQHPDPGPGEVHTIRIDPAEPCWYCAATNDQSCQKPFADQPCRRPAK